MDFLTDLSDKILFGTDCLHPKQELPIIDFLVKADIAMKHKRRISHENALRLLGIPTPQ